MIKEIVTLNLLESKLVDSGTTEDDASVGQDADNECERIGD